MEREEPHPKKIIGAKDAAYWLDCSVRSVKERIRPLYYEGTRPKFRYQQILDYQRERSEAFQKQQNRNRETVRRAA